jgi:hypothetical protein
MAFLRYGLPLLLFVGGFIVLFVAGDSNATEGWAMLVGSALALIVWNVLFRIGFSGDKDRDDEEAARQFMREHGHWPDEPPPQGPRAPRP